MPFRPSYLILLILPLSGLACITRDVTSDVPSSAQPSQDTPQPRDSPAPVVKGTARGKVLDDDGNPIVGASVWVIASYSGIRRYHETFVTQTDTDGSYGVEGLPAVATHSRGWSGDGLAISAYAVVPGRPPVNVQFQAMTDDSVVPDLVVPGRGSSLAVRVLSETGNPVAGATVEVSAPVDGVPREFYGGNRNKKNADSLRRAMRPRHVTDSAGVARFTGLLPGRYTVHSTILSKDSLEAGTSRDNDTFQQRFSHWNATSGKVAVCHGVPVAPGGEASYTLRLHSVRGNFVVRYKLPDGSFYSGTGASIGTPPAANPEQPNNEGGIGNGTSEVHTDWDFSLGLSPGLRRVTARMKPEPPHESAQKEPFLWSQTVIAHSPFWSKKNPLIIPVRRVEAGSLRVRVFDENGRPLQGMTLESNIRFSRPDEARQAKTDGEGVAILAGLPSGESEFNVLSLPLLQDTVKENVKTFPEDSKLDKRRTWRTTSFTVHRGQRTNGEITAERVGFLRGKVQGAPEGYLMYNFLLERQIGAKHFYDRKTGDYLIGPVPVGEFRFSFRGAKGGYDATVDVPNGVLRHDFATDPRLAFTQEADETKRNRVRDTQGKVFLPDGTTPAINASVWVTDARSFFPSTGFVTDANGRMRLSGLAERGYSTDPFGASMGGYQKSPGGPRERVILAYLPGSHGAIVRPFPESVESKEVRLVLPPPITLPGTVSLDGKPLSDVPGFTRVRAVPENQGELTAALTVEVTVQADGSFLLSGLTPGLTYRVQAALENIYLSPEKVVTVPVQAPKALPSVVLRLPRPGASVVVPVGIAYADAPATLVEKLPGGPLSAQTYARFYPVDGAGGLRVEGLSAGKWHLRLPDGKIIAVTVPPATFSGETP